MSDFEWNAADGSTIVPRTDAIAVYCNPAGDVCIRQQVWGMDDAIIIIPRDRAKDVAKAITAMAR